MDDITRDSRVEVSPPEMRPAKGPSEAVAGDLEVVDEVALSRGLVTPDRMREPEPLRIAPLNSDSTRVTPSDEDRPNPPAEDEPQAAEEPQTADGEPQASPEAVEANAEPAEAPEAAATAEPAGDDPESTPQPRAATDDEDDEAPALDDPTEIARVALPLLLSTREAVSYLRLAEVCGTTSKKVQAGLDELQKILTDNGLPLELSRTGDKVKILTLPAVYPFLKRFKGLKRAAQLSPAALETLAVIAYRQPVIRAEIESIRGVKAGPMLRSLLEHKLVKVVGRADVPGRPLQYGTTQTFLERFGLESLKELPSIQEFKSLG